MKRSSRSVIILLLLFFAGCSNVAAPRPNFKEQLLPELLDNVPSILKSQDATTGRFGTGIWIVTDQNPMVILAVVWSLKHEKNPYYHDPKLLNAIMLAGDALIADQDKTGRWEFRKKDGSTWGPIYMPWIYSRWIRSFGLIKDAMPPDRRAKWENAITLGAEGIIRAELVKPVQNIPGHNAMAVYHAGQIFHRDDWCKAGRDYLHKVADAQDKDGGFWSEHVGPVMAYNFVYVDLLGNYYAMSHDRYVLPALERAARYHANFTYPDGSAVETVDERNPYHNHINAGNVGFTFSPEGRGFLHQQFERIHANKEHVPYDLIAALWQFGQEGPMTTPGSTSRYIMGHNDAMAVRDGDFFACFSAYTAPISKERWIQDRQNLLSLFHTKTGLIVGGGNTKLQPLWSTFTLGDTKLLHHTSGTTNPVFLPPRGIIHTPGRATLDPDVMKLSLLYGTTSCSVQLHIDSPNAARVTYALDGQSDLPVEAHATFLPHLSRAWKTASGKSGVLNSQPLHLTSEETGGWFEHAGWRVSVPQGASIVWPVLPHNPYVRDGAAKPDEGRIVLVMPLGNSPTSREIEIRVD